MFSGSPKKLGGVTLIPEEPPVSQVALRITYSMMNWAAIVAIAR